MVCLGILTFELQFYNWSDRSYIHQSSYFYQPEKKSYLNEPKVFKKKKIRSGGSFDYVKWPLG